MDKPEEIIARKLGQHSALEDKDVGALASLPYRIRSLQPGENFAAAGDEPDVCAVVLDGVAGRYVELEHGHRQYISFHFRGEWPGAHAVLRAKLDHAACAMGAAQIALVGKKELMAVCMARPSLTFALWRESLADAVLSRQTILNIGGRSTLSRLAHLLCELYVRSRAAGVAKIGSCSLPLTQENLAAALGMSLVTLNRTMQALRRTNAVEFRTGSLMLRDFQKLARIGGFDPAYLHLSALPRL
jgi:CRP-like cAMP-binding protein